MNNRLISLLRFGAIIVFSLFAFSVSDCHAQEQGYVYNVTRYGAIGDGKTLDTPAITRAIEAASKNGGGTVFFPAGTYVTGTFELLSNVTLRLGDGSVLEGSRDTSQYKLKSYFKLRAYKSGQSGEGLRAGIIVANHANNIAIVGHGTIQGNGMYFMNPKTPHYGGDFVKSMTWQGEAFLSPKFGDSDGPIKPWMPWADRPGALIILAQSENVLVKDITIKDSPNWTVNIEDCKNVEVRGINILNSPLIPNNDGINIMAKNARISDCNIWTADDGIAANECDNLTVTNCVISSRSSAIRFDGGRYCTFDNLIFRDTNRGIGVYDSARYVLFSNIIMQTHQFTGDWWGKAEPIYVVVRLEQPFNGRTLIKDIRFTNITANAEDGIIIYGTRDNVIKNITLDHIRLKIKGGAHADAVGGNFDLRGLGANPALSLFKHDIPGIYAQYVDGLHIDDFKLEWADSLPPYFSNGIYCEHFKDIRIDGFSGRQAQLHGSKATITLEHGEDVSIMNSSAPKGTGTFLYLKDVKDRRQFLGNDLRDARRPSEPSGAGFMAMSGNLLPHMVSNTSRHPK